MLVRSRHRWIRILTLTGLVIYALELPDDFASVVHAQGVDPPDLPALTFDETEVARLEELALSDREAARPMAQRLKDQIELQIGTERHFADEAAEKAREWRELAETARTNAERNRQRAEAAGKDAKNPALSEQIREIMSERAKISEEQAQADEERAAERGARAMKWQREAERRYDRLAIGGELIERLNRVIEESEPEPEPEVAEGEAAQPEPTKAAEEAPPLKFAVDEVLGMWRPVESPSWPFVIVQEDPESNTNPYRLEAHTDSRVWKGTYTSWDAGDPMRSQNARLEFRYKPRPDEMNPEIPGWARERVHGNLEWRLELDEAGDDFEPLLRMKLFPGEVRWSERGDQTAEVIGEGLPRVFELEPVDSIQIEALSMATIAVGLPGPHDPDVYPPEALLKHQRFFVRVTLPAELAKEQGTSLDVTIRGLSGGDTETLTLTGTRPVGLRPVVYTHVEPVTIADCNLWTEPKREQPLLSLAWIFGMEGACLDLSVEDRETVEFRFGDVYQQVVLYDSWVQRGLVRHDEGTARLRALLEPALTGQTQGADREAVHKRLRMIANYEAIKASEKLTDLHRYWLGEVYLGEGGKGLVFVKDAKIEARYRQDARFPWRNEPDPNYFNPLMQAYLEGLTGDDLTPDAHTAGQGIVWTSDAERYYVINALRETSESLASNAVQAFAEKFSFGLYDGFVSATLAGPLYLVVTGEDHFGRQVPTWMRLTAAMGLTSAAVLHIAGPTAVQSFVSRLTRSSRLGMRTRAATTLVAQGTRGATRLDGLQPVPGLPASLKGPQRAQTALRLTGEAGARSGASCVSRSRRSPPVHTIRNRRQNPAMDAEFEQYIQDAKYINDHYGPNAKMVNPFDDEIFPRQRGTTCNVMSLNYGIYKATGRFVDEGEAFGILYDLMAAEYRRGKRPLEEIFYGAGVVEGFDNRATHMYLRYQGARVAKVYVPTAKQIKAGVRPTRIRLRHIKTALDDGWQVKMILEFPGEGYHSVLVDSLIRNTKTGKFSMVRIFDSNLGRLVDVPAGHFKRMIPTPESHPPYSIMTVFRWD